MVHIDIFLF
jgi:hypothetical protein